MTAGNKQTIADEYELMAFGTFLVLVSESVEILYKQGISYVIT